MILRKNANAADYSLPAAIIMMCITISPVSAQDFCTTALANIPFENNAVVSTRNIDRSIWSASCSEEFEKEDSFRSWSKSRDANASYNLYSASYGESKVGTNYDFKSSYASYCSSFESTYSEANKDSDFSTRPSEAFINQVLSGCVNQRGIYVVARPESESPNKFVADIRFKAGEGELLKKIEFTSTNATCKIGGGSSAKEHEVTKNRITAICDRIDPLVRTVGFDSTVGATTFQMPLEKEYYLNLVSTQNSIKERVADLEAAAGDSPKILFSKIRSIKETDLDGPLKSTIQEQAINLEKTSTIIVLGSIRIGRRDGKTDPTILNTSATINDDDICAQNRYQVPQGNAASAFNQVICVRELEPGTHTFKVEHSIGGAGGFNRKGQSEIIVLRL